MIGIIIIMIIIIPHTGRMDVVIGQTFTRLATRFYRSRYGDRTAIHIQITGKSHWYIIIYHFNTNPILDLFKDKDLDLFP